MTEPGVAKHMFDSIDSQEALMKHLPLSLLSSLLVAAGGIALAAGCEQKPSGPTPTSSAAPPAHVTPASSLGGDSPSAVAPDKKPPASAATPPPGKTTQPAARPSAAAVAPAVTAIQAFTADLYPHLVKDDDNLFFSGASIATAFAMTHAGAAGKTADEIRAALHLPNNGAYEAFGAFGRLLNASRGDTVLRMANRMWHAKDAVFQAPFVDILKTAFGSTTGHVNFANAEPARAAINKWVAGQTDDKIVELIPDGAITGLTRLVLTNAVYFKGLWADAFDKKLTKVAPFSRRDGTKVDASFMQSTDKHRLRVDPKSGLQRLELPYKDGGLSMVVFLPRDAAGLAQLEAELPTHLKTAAKPIAETTQVYVKLPKFELRSPIDLRASLNALGIERAFSPGAAGADFSKINGKKNLYITDAFHQGWVKVDEAGTEAAAATAVVVGLKGMAAPPQHFVADRPFVFGIRDDATGGFLFLGRVMDPTVK